MDHVFDGSFSFNDTGAGVLLMSPTSEHLRYMVQMLFGDGQATNNTVEYEGLLAGLRAAEGLGIKRLIVRGDSQLVINQVTKEFECPQMAAYVAEVRKLERRFDGLQMEHVPRAMNSIEDELSKVAAWRGPVPPGTFIERLTHPSISPAKVKDQVAPCPGKGTPPALVGGRVPGDPGEEPPKKNSIPAKHVVLAMERQCPPWAADLIRFLQDHSLPAEDQEAERVACQAKMYALVDGDIYRW